MNRTQIDICNFKRSFHAVIGIILKTIARVMFCVSLLHHNSHNVRSGLNIPVTSTSSQVDTDSIGSALVMEVRYQSFVM